MQNFVTSVAANILSESPYTPKVIGSGAVVRRKTVTCPSATLDVKMPRYALGLL